MNRVAITSMIILFFSGFASGERDRTDAVIVDAVGFTGLNRIARSEILSGTMAGHEGKVVVYMDRLKTRLAGHPYVDSFSIDQGTQGLIVRVQEKEPVMRVVFEGNERSDIFEIDPMYRIISRERISSSRIPTVFLAKEGLAHRQSMELMRIFSIIMSINKENSILYNEIERIHLKNDGTVVVKLRSRKTLFKLELTELHMIKLDSLVGFLDREEDQPALAEMYDTVTVIQR